MLQVGSISYTMTKKHWNSKHRAKICLLWKEYFADPSLWFNNRKFKSLWINGCCNPTWVYEELNRRVIMLPADATSFLGNEEINNEHTTTCVTFVGLLKMCAKKKDINEGSKLHADIWKLGLLDKNSHLVSTLISMYAKCGALAKAHEVHEGVPVQNVVTWNALIAGYVQHGRGQDALNCFEQMQMEGISPDAITFLCILKACACIGAIKKGIEIHDEIVHKGILKENIMISSALVDMYAKFGLMDKAKQVLEGLSEFNEVTWSALISGYVQHGQDDEAIRCLERMQSEGIYPDAVTFVSVLKACGNKKAITEGKRVHNEILSRGLLKKNVVLGNALIDMYTKCGMLSKAHELHNELPARSVISWSALIAGHIKSGQCHDAMHCFEQMQNEGFSPNAVTFTCVLKACGSSGAIDKGKQIHEEIASRGLHKKDVVLGNALIDMYTKCGMLTNAEEVLNDLHIRNVITWSTLIAGYAKQGRGHEALNCFEHMQSDGLSPDAVTFVSVLNACCHSGLLNEAHTYYGSMSKIFGIAPTLEHHTCMMTIYGFEGHFDEALSVIETMSSSHYPQVWLTLLGSCRKQGALEFGKTIFDRSIQSVQLDERV